MMGFHTPGVLLLLTALLKLVRCTVDCRRPMPCTEYLAADSPCLGTTYTTAYDKSLEVEVCAMYMLASGGEARYQASSAINSVTCTLPWKGDGRCDLPNDHAGCDFDGGDCCRSTCEKQCAEGDSDGDPLLYSRPTCTIISECTSEKCVYVCGESQSYFCLDPAIANATTHQWCEYGAVMTSDDCYHTKLDVTVALLECILDDRSHGNELYTSVQCGNQSTQCTLDDVTSQNGCHIERDHCISRPCCNQAIINNFIEAYPATLPTLADLYDTCSAAQTEDFIDCFPYMVRCIQDNKAIKGGCCQCQPGWGGWRCRYPLCWPKCIQGTCSAPDRCHCDTGWGGEDCSHALCDPECVPGQGTCVLPNTCECFYGWTGTQCEQPMSTPSCINGQALAPDLCLCADGWGGRICDYPICQTWPEPSADCVHGSCVSPFSCECEPGWQNYRPINSTGYEIEAFWSPGRDVSQATESGFVVADSRIIFVTYFDRYYNTSNAAQCLVPDCAHIYDPRCTQCDMPPGGCTLCEPGFFVEPTSGRCERCSNVLPHCQLCGPIQQGPDFMEVFRCTHCDPLYVLEPVSYGSNPTARCVSDGTVEFSSPVYHVFKDGGYVQLVLQRNGHAAEPAWARPVEVMVRTRDATAHSRSIEFGGTLATYELTSTHVHFGIDTSVDLPDCCSEEYNIAVQQRVEAEKEVRIPIYDDVSFHVGMLYFDVEVLLPPELLSGHQGPLWPFLTSEDHEPSMPWLAPQEFGRSPLLERQDVLSSARVYVWDREEATAANSTCSGACEDWETKTEISTPRYVEIAARTHEGMVSNSSRDKFLVKYLPASPGYEDALGTVTEAILIDAANGIHGGNYTPSISGPYRLAVEKAVPGVRGQYWWYRKAGHLSKQLPDTDRIDHDLKFHWPDVSRAPAFARWSFHLHFDCIQEDSHPDLPKKVGAAFGIHVSPGVTVAAYYWNQGLVDELTVPVDAEIIDPLTMNDTVLCSRTSTGAPAYSTFICIDMLETEPRITPDGTFAFMIELTTSMPTLLEETMEAYIEILMWQPIDTETTRTWVWLPIQRDCLLSSGLHISGSPYEGFEAFPGEASTYRSTVTDLLGNTDGITIFAGEEGELRIDLRDESGALILSGDYLDSLSALLITSSGFPDGNVADIVWSEALGYYAVSLVPQNTEPGAGTFERYLLVTLDGTSIKYSPFPVTVKTEISDPMNTSIISGHYSPMRVAEPMNFQLQSYDLAGVLRVTGGDIYSIYFEGPAHDPLPNETQFDAVVTDLQNGVYDVHWEIDRPGIYIMHVLLNGVHIRDSPFENVSVYDDLSATLTRASGPGIDMRVPVAVMAGAEMEFNISARDSYDIQYYKGGARFDINITAFDLESGDFLNLTDYQDGSYNVRYSICRAGRTPVNIQLFTQGEWRHIQGSPFTVEVLPGDAQAAFSQLHSIGATPRSGMPTQAHASLRDHCGNIPGPAGGVSLTASLTHQGSSSMNASYEDSALSDWDNATDEEENTSMDATIWGEVPVDIVHIADGEVTIFFTPGPRGLHLLSVSVAGRHVQASPMEVYIDAAGEVPSEPEAQWVVGAVGASSLSTFTISRDTILAGEESHIEVLARDFWGVPLALGNDTFLVGLWREGGPCPPATRCAAFSMSSQACGRVPSCHFDSRNSACYPACNSSSTYSLADVESKVCLLKAVGDTYTFVISTMVAGSYWGTVSALRPGGWHFHFFTSEDMLERSSVQVLKGPLDFTWGHSNLDGSLGSGSFAVRALGWLRLPVHDHYIFRLECDGNCRLVINNTELVKVAVEDGHSMGMTTFELRSGYVPVQLEYAHQYTQRAVGAYLRLAFGAGSLPFEVVPARSMYYEEVLEQPDNPTSLVVKPVPEAKSIAVDGHWMQRWNATAGSPLTIRLHALDTYGNILTCEDPAAWVELHSQPMFITGQWQSGVLAATRWKVVPHETGDWDVVLWPDAAPLTYNLSFELRTLAAGGVMFKRSLQVDVVPGEVHPETSWMSCSPRPPQPAGTLVTCIVVPEDADGNELEGQEVQLFALPPGAAAMAAWERTADIESSDPVARTFQLRPAVAGIWHLQGNVTFAKGRFVTVPAVAFPYEVTVGRVSRTAMGTTVEVGSLLTKEPIHLNITARDAYGNVLPAELGAEEWHVRLRGGANNSVNLLGVVTPQPPSTYRVDFPAIANQSTYQLSVQHLNRHHNDSLAHCPELAPTFGRVASLSNYRAYGSEARMECLPGYTRASGNEVLLCESTEGLGEDNLGEWHDRFSLPAHELFCRPQRSWCQQLDLVNADLLLWDWRREVGSRATIACKPGHELLLGDTDVVCGSRYGRGVWLTLTGSLAIVPAICAPIGQLCPELVTLGSHIANLSAGRQPGSVVHLACNPGFVAFHGSDVLACSGEGVWVVPNRSMPVSPGTELQCVLDEDYCPDPGAFLEMGVHLRQQPHRSLGSIAEFDCAEGYTKLLGESSALCAVPKDSHGQQGGRWVNAEEAYRGQVELQPLRCKLMQEYCPGLEVEYGHVVSQSAEQDLGSTAVLECAVGFQLLGGDTAVECGHSLTTAGTGAWLGPIGRHAERVHCVKDPYFCPELPNLTGTVLSVSDGLRLSSILTMDCSYGYEPDTFREGSTMLVCRANASGQAGEWTTPDGLPVNASSMRCRGSQHHCAAINWPSGKVHNFVGARTPGSSALLRCDLGYEIWSNGIPWPNEMLLVTCDAGSPEHGSFWRTEEGEYLDTAWCTPTQFFCLDSLPAFTRKVGVTEAMDMESGSYEVAFEGNRTYGSWATLRCNEALHYFYSYGDTSVRCGYDANQTAGAWRSTNGMLAVPLHCYYDGSLVNDTVWVKDDCFEPHPLPYTFGRQGGILFWVQPSEWLLGAALVRGEHGVGGTWELLISEPGVFSAQVAPDLGNVSVNVTQGGTKGLLDWYHVALVWELGEGLAGLGYMSLWVDGVQSLSGNLDHFTWVDPGDLHVGGFGDAPNVSGTYSKLRVYGRAPPAEEITAVREAEDPECGILTRACPRPTFTNAYTSDMDNPKDARFALFALRPYTVAFIACDPGFTRTDGDEIIECSKSGIWTRPSNTTHAATALRCCKTAEEWCPTIDLTENPGAVVAASAGATDVTCLDQWNSGMGITYVPCDPLVVPFGNVVYSDGTKVGSIGSLACDSGFGPLDPLLMDETVVCMAAAYDSQVHVNKEVPASWVGFRGPPNLECVKKQNWCQDPLSLLPNSRVNQTTGRSKDSLATVECLPGYQASWTDLPWNGTDENDSLKLEIFEGALLHLFCTADPAASDVAADGVWLAPGYGFASLEVMSCTPTPHACSDFVSELLPATGSHGVVRPMEVGSYHLHIDGDTWLGSLATVSCEHPYTYSYGDNVVVCRQKLDDTGSSFVLYGHDGVPRPGEWQSITGNSPTRLHCRDERPAVDGASWYSSSCFRGEETSRQVPIKFGAQGTLTLWMQIPEMVEYSVIWSSGCDPPPSTTATTSTVTITTTSTSETSSTTTLTVTSTFTVTTTRTSSTTATMTTQSTTISTVTLTTLSTSSTMSSTSTTITTSSSSTTSATSTSVTSSTLTSSTTSTVSSKTTTTTSTSSSSLSSTSTSSSTTLTATTLSATSSTVTMTSTSTSDSSTSTQSTGTDTTSTTQSTTSTTRSTTSTTTTSTVSTTTSTSHTSSATTTTMTSGTATSMTSSTTSTRTSATGSTSSSTQTISFSSTTETGTTITSTISTLSASSSTTASTTTSSMTAIGTSSSSTTTTSVSGTSTTSSSTGTTTSRTSVTTLTETSTSTSSSATSSSTGTTTTTTSTASSTTTITHTGTSTSTSQTTRSDTSTSASSVSLTTTSRTATTTTLTSTTETSTSETTSSTGTTATSTTSTSWTSTITATATTETSTSTSTTTTVSTTSETSSTSTTATSTGTTVSATSSTSTQTTDTTTTETSTGTVTSTSTTTEEPCLGPQHLVLDGELLQGQLGAALGRVLVNLTDLGLGAATWIHLAFAWAYGNGTQDMNRTAGLSTRLYINGVEVLEAALPDNSSNYDEIGFGDVPWMPDFELFLGRAPTASGIPWPAGGQRAKPRAYVEELGQTEIAALHHFDMPPFCVECPEPVEGSHRRSQVVLAESSDRWVPPVRIAPGTRLRLECQRGYVQTGGSSLVECTGVGEWVNPETNLSVTWLECCDFEPAFCPDLNMTGTVVLNSTTPPPCGPGDEGNTTFTSSTATIFRNVGARIHYRCLEGHVRISGSEALTCTLSGTWIDEYGGRPAPLVCEEDQHYCPSLNISDSHSYAVNVTAGQRLGSIAFFMCMDSYVPIPGTGVTLRCVTQPDGRRGHWVNASGQPTPALQCASSSPPEDSTQGGVIQRFLADASFSCLPPYIWIHGDEALVCSRGPNETSSGGVSGLWFDPIGDVAEPLLCELRANWCPPVDLGSNTAVANLTDAYRYGSTASLRCLVGYLPTSGSKTLRCWSDETGLHGEWHGEPLECQAARNYCPGLHPVNASSNFHTEPNYQLGESVSFQCFPGFTYVSGDFEAECGIGDGGGALGVWRRSDGAVAQPLVCSQEKAFCERPEVGNGRVEHLSAGGSLASVAELRCHAGFRDPRGIDRRTSICLAEAVDGGTPNGAFVAGLSAESRDLLRAEAVVRDIVDMLDQHEARIWTAEDVYQMMDFDFEARWVSELQRALFSLRYGRLVRSVLAMLPAYHGVDRGELELFTASHARILHRLLVAKMEEQHDISAERAQALFGTHMALKINFQDRATPAVDGWHPDFGEVFAARSNGLSYGWLCDVSEAAINIGAVNRGRRPYTVLENTLVLTDMNSWCPDQEWRIQLQQGQYEVQVTIQDTQREQNASGCLLQGQSLGFPAIVNPLDGPVRRELVVEVHDFLRLSNFNGSGACASVNRITIQSIGIAGTVDEPLLACEPIQDWCTMPSIPSNSHRELNGPSTTSWPLGGEVEFTCNESFVFHLGAPRSFCGSSVDGHFGQWRALTGDTPQWLDCQTDRSWCPVLVVPEPLHVVSFSPQANQLNSTAMLACKPGYEPTGTGDFELRCNGTGSWCAMQEDGSCTVPSLPHCIFVAQYCPALTEPSAPANATHASTTTTVTFSLPLSAGALGDVAAVACPAEHHRVHGEAEVVCTHAKTNSGVWEARHAVTTHLVDEAVGAALLCELDGVYGVRRKSFSSVGQLFRGGAFAHADTVPNIDQLISDYTAAKFDGYLRPLETGNYTLSVEVIGRVVLSMDNAVILQGRSSGADPEVFSVAVGQLSSSELHVFSLHYSLDPVLGLDSHVHLKSTVRLLWQLPGSPRTVVPPAALFHSLEEVHGFPTELTITNDPAPCTAEVVEFSNLAEGDVGFLVDGHPDHDYNDNLHCQWEISSGTGEVLFSFVVNLFDIEETVDCEGDRLEIWAVNILVATLCGSRPAGSVLVETVAQRINIKFITDDLYERAGFNITYNLSSKDLFAP